VESAGKGIRHLDEFDRRRIKRIGIFTVIIAIGRLFYVTDNGGLFSVIVLVNILMCVHQLFKKNKQVSDFYSMMIRFLGVDLGIFLGSLTVQYSVDHFIDGRVTSWVLMSCLLLSVGTAYFISQYHPLSKGHLKLIDQLLSGENEIDSVIFMSTYLQVNGYGNVEHRLPLIEYGNTKLKQVEKDEILLVFLHRSNFTWNKEYHYNENKIDSFGRNICLVKRNTITKL